MRYIVGFKLRMFGLGFELARCESQRPAKLRAEVKDPACSCLHEMNYKSKQKRLS